MRALALSLSALGLLSGAATASIPPEIPFASPVPVGARPMGMGGAYVAVAEDYHALSYNPAGLAQVRRIELGGVFEGRSLDQRNTYLEESQSTTADHTRIQSLGFAYPFPTYRGSLVIGFAYERLFPLDQEYFRSGAGGPLQMESEAISENGSVGAWQAGFAAAASPTLNLGVTATLLTGSSDRSREFTYAGTNPVNRERTFTETTIDYTAVTGSLGALVTPNEHVRIGLTLHLPSHFTLNGSGHDDIFRVQANPEDTIDINENFAFDDEIKLPFRLAGGLSWSGNGLLVSGDLTYADWKEIDYAGAIRADDREFAYDSTVDIRVGAEYLLRPIPLRLRAGFASQPLPYDLVATDVFNGTAARAEIEQDRRFFTFGLGYLVDESLSLDLGIAKGGFERRGRSDAGVETVEKVDESRVMAGATFRL